MQCFSKKNITLKRTPTKTQYPLQFSITTNFQHIHTYSKYYESISNSLITHSHQNVLYIILNFYHQTIKKRNNQFHQPIIQNSINIRKTSKFLPKYTGSPQLSITTHIQNIHTYLKHYKPALKRYIIHNSTYNPFDVTGFRYQSVRSHFRMNTQSIFEAGDDKNSIIIVGPLFNLNYCFVCRWLWFCGWKVSE